MKGKSRRRIWLLAILVTIALLAGWSYANRWGSTPPFRDLQGAPIKGSIAEMQRVRLGGVDQSITIRGKSAKAPILIWLFGGPGMDATGMTRKYNAALEDDFLVVYWVQRGAGRSYSSDIPVASMNRARFVGDLDELIDTLRKRFGPSPVTLLGHSWGTSVGIDYARTHPEKLAAYVGVGQVAFAAEGERRSYAFTLAEARRRSDAKAIEELTKIGPPPYPRPSLIVQRNWLNEYGGAWRTPRSLPKLMWESFGASEMTLVDGLYFQRGLDFSENALTDEIGRVNWMRDAPRLAVPVFILAGRYDRNTDADLQHEYFDALEAPMKRFHWFENSAHSPPYEEADAFNRYLIDEVLPVAKGQVPRPAKAKP
jgi:proline iminopeptidase